MKITEMIRAQIAELSEKRDGYLNEIEAITELATTESRSQLNEIEETAFRAAETALKAIDTDIEAMEKRCEDLDKLEQRISASRSRNLRAPGTLETPEAIDVMSHNVSNGDLIARAKTFVEKDRYYQRASNGFAAGEGITEKLDGHNEDLAAWTARLVLAGGTKEYLRAWTRAMTGTPLDSDDARAVHKMQAVQRALSVAGGNGTGGYGIPTMLDPTLILTAAVHTSPIRRLARVENLTYENQWRGLAAGGVVASWDTETSTVGSNEVSDDSPTFTQPTVDTHLARVFVPFSIEISEDFPNLLGDLAMMFAEAKQILEDVAFVSGDGSTAPKGIATVIGAVTAMRVSATTGGTFGQPDIYKLQNALPVRFRMGMGNRAYVMNNAVINLIRQFPTAVGVQGYLSELGNGQPTRLIGDELVESSVMTSTVTTGNCLAIFGDFKRYMVVNKIGVQTELIPHLFATATNMPNGQRGLFMRWRIGGDVIDQNAFKGLTL